MESKCAEGKMALTFSCAFFIQRKNGSVTKITQVIFEGTALYIWDWYFFLKPWSLSTCISFSSSSKKQLEVQDCWIISKWQLLYKAQSCLCMSIPWSWFNLNADNGYAEEPVLPDALICTTLYNVDTVFPQK